MKAMEKELLVEKIKKYINEKYGSLDYFTEQQLIDYCLGKAKEKEELGKAFKVQDVNVSGIVKYLHVKHFMSYDLIAQSAERLAIQYSRLSSNPSTKEKPILSNIDRAEVSEVVENKLNSYYLNGNVASHLGSDGTTITYETIEPVA